MNELIYPWAVAYHQAGWCVLPAKDKFPLKALGGWKQYQKERPSLEQVQEWFAQAPEGAQIALVTGRVSGVTVIDIDTHREGCPGKKGRVCECEPEAVDDIAAQLGISGVKSITGSGGRHVFCDYENVGNSVGLAHPQLDIRSDGGIIILPPSMHESGNEYEWDKMFPWNVENLDALLPFPARLKVLLKEREKTDWNDVVGGVGEGKRNHTAAAMAGKLVKCFGRDCLPAAWELLSLWNHHRNKPPLSTYELNSTFKSIIRSEYGE
jgi:hypothetical protein|tara:strand:- start:1129 stop:1926 length:798 start_codon:yes stop_codon:yes gene_type:complete